MKYVHIYKWPMSVQDLYTDLNVQKDTNRYYIKYNLAIKMWPSKLESILKDEYMLHIAS